jgi:hypothetical protein
MSVNKLSKIAKKYDMKNPLPKQKQCDYVVKTYKGSK